MSSGQTAQDPAWKSREQAEEARYIHDKEQAQLATLRSQLDEDATKAGSESQASKGADTHSVPREDRDYEAGYGGQEDLEDRYATTSGEH